MHDRHVGWFTEQPLVICNDCVDQWVSKIYVKFENEGDNNNFQLYFNWAKREFENFLEDKSKFLSHTSLIRYRTFDYSNSRSILTSIVTKKPTYRDFSPYNKLSHFELSNVIDPIYE